MTWKSQNVEKLLWHSCLQWLVINHIIPYTLYSLLYTYDIIVPFKQLSQFKWQLFRCICQSNCLAGVVISERYKPLAYPSNKLQFLGLQLELLEDFRARLAQVKSAEETLMEPLGHTPAAILNTASYIEEILNEWRELPVSRQPESQYHTRNWPYSQLLEAIVGCQSIQPHISPSKILSTINRTLSLVSVSILRYT